MFYVRQIRRSIIGYRIYFSLCWIVFALVSLCGCGSVPDKPQTSYRIAEVLAGIPEEDHHSLEALFSRLVLGTSAAYTLFGPKPISLESYRDDILSFFSDDLLRPMDTLILSKGWQSWERYGHLFPSKRYLLRRFAFQLQGSSYRYLVVMNMPAVLNTIRRHYDLFEPLLPGGLGPEHILAEMKDSDDFLKRVLDDSERLGVLLGYGRVNAHGFDRRLDICIHLNQCMIPPMASSPEMPRLNPRSRFFVEGYRGHCSRERGSVGKLTPSPGYESLVEELNAICDHFEGFNLVQDELLEQFMPPVFMAYKSDRETLELRQAYAKARLHLPEVIFQKPILETVLTKWVSDDP